MHNYQTKITCSELFSFYLFDFVVAFLFHIVQILNTNTLKWAKLHKNIFQIIQSKVFYVYKPLIEYESKKNCQSGTYIYI